jgi:23S rRNA (pseudouridine1915-N3)-methyltransferase
VKLLRLFASSGRNKNTLIMNIKLIAIGKTDNKSLQTLIDDYTKRLSFYIKFDLEIIPDIKNVKNLSESQQKGKRRRTDSCRNLTPTDQLILLDENGKNFSSVGFSEELQKKMNSGIKTLVFVIGGPYGFSDIGLQQSAGENFAFADDVFTSNGTFVFY